MNQRSAPASSRLLLTAWALVSAVGGVDGAAAQRPASGAHARWAAMPVFAPRADASAAMYATPALRVTGPGRHLAAHQEADDSPMAGMTGSGFFLGIIGMLAGTAVGSAMADRDCVDDCRRDLAARGALIGGTLLIPLGVHIANPDPGSLPAATAASGLLGTAMWFLVAALPSDPMPLAPFLAAPLQLQGAIHVEQWIR